MKKKPKIVPPHKKIGRPKMEDKERLSGSLDVRVTSDEKKAFQAAAKKQGVSLSEWLRTLANREIQG